MNISSNTMEKSFLIVGVPSLESRCCFLQKRSIKTYFDLKSTFSFCLQLFMALCLAALCVNCRPADPAPREDLIDVEDTDDEFKIPKPADPTDPSYTEFLNELYKNDPSKQKPKAKRETQPDKLTVETPQEYNIPAKPASQDPKYDQYLTNLYRHDEEKLHRSKRMIVFRHESFIHQQ